MSGLHKNGFGWNVRGVFCGECGRDTCKGCQNEYKPWSGLSEETIERIRNKVNDGGFINMGELIQKSAKLSWCNHKNHYEILKEFYALNKYLITEQFKDTLLDAIECMEYTMTAEGEDYKGGQ